MRMNHVLVRYPSLVCTTLFSFAQPPLTLLNRFFFKSRAAELCDQARALPDSSPDKKKLLADTDGLALMNERLKRALEGKKDALNSAIRAQVGCIIIVADYDKQ